MTLDKPTVLVHWTDAGETTYYVSEDARLLFVDDRCPDDRVYEFSLKATHEQIRELIGGCPIGHELDGFLSENKLQAIRAALWQSDGNELAVVDHTE